MTGPAAAAGAPIVGRTYMRVDDRSSRKNFA